MRYSVDQGIHSRSRIYLGSWGLDLFRVANNTIHGGATSLESLQYNTFCFSNKDGTL